MGLLPNQLSLNPGANPTGAPMAGFLTPAMGSGTLGNAQSPFNTPMPTGTNMPAPTAPAPTPFTPTPYAPAPGATTAALTGQPGAAAGGLNVSTLSGLLPVTAPGAGAQQDDLAKGLQAMGMSGGVGTVMAEFLMRGAGYSPDVANALIAAMQPKFQQDQANLMEQFGSHGLAMGSPAALGMSNLYAQQDLNVGQLLSNLYEQSVNNYIGVLTGGKVAGPGNTGGGLLNTIGQAAGGIASGIAGLFGL